MGDDAVKIDGWILVFLLPDDRIVVGVVKMQMISPLSTIFHCRFSRMAVSISPLSNDCQRL